MKQEEKRDKEGREIIRRKKNIALCDRRNAAETSVTGIRGWIEDFDDKYTVIHQSSQLSFPNLPFE